MLVCISDIGTSTIRFQDTNKLLNFKSNYQFSNMMMNINCLSIKAEVNNDAEVLQLIEFVNGLTMKKKALILIMPDLNLRNLTLNFDMTVYSKNKGSEYFLRRIRMVLKQDFFYLFLCLTSQVSVTSHLSAQLWAKGMLSSMMACAP